MVVAKRKTVTKVTGAFQSRAVKANLKSKATLKDNAEAGIAERKMMKKPAAAAEKAKQKKDLEESEEESEDEEEEEEQSARSAKTMKRPAAAGSKMEESEDEDEEDEDDDEEDEDEEEEEGAKSKTMKRPAATSKKMEVDEEEESDDEEEDEDEEEEEGEVDSKVMKKPAGRTQKKAEEDEEEEDESEEEDDTAAQLVAVAEEKEPTEKELMAERTKELKAMSASDMKELMDSHGLEKGTKEAMIKALLKHEAKVRGAAKEQKAKIRSVVVKKKQELEDMSPTELGKLCNDAGLKGLKSKPERVQRLLVQWQENDGVDQALAKIAEDERKSELGAMDNTKLRKFCGKLGVDPFVKEIMVERISKDENQRGFYARPAIKQTGEEAQKEKKGDMIDELLANEAERKKERIFRNKQEEALSKKRKDLKAMSVDELKKRIAKKGLECSGKRDEMIEALFIAGVQDDKAAERKVELQKKSQPELKELLVLNGLEPGSKEQMVKAMLAHEAKCREELRVFEAKVDEAAAIKQKQLESKSNSQLKEMCASKALPTKGEKSERVEHLVEEAKKEHQFDSIVSTGNRNKRKDELMAMDKAAVLKLCEANGVDPFVKDIMIERILSQESEAGAIAVGDAEPAAKKARTSKK